MVLSDEQDTTFRKLCEEIKPGEHGHITVEFVGTPSNIVRISGEKNYRFYSQKTEPTTGEPQDRRGSGRL
jgi:hypothetical protein